MNKYEKVKDIILPIIIAACSVAVAIYANELAKSANEIAELQALIAKNSEAPTIEVVHMPGGSDSEASLEISILDGKYSNFRSETVSFLSFVFSGYDDDDRWATLDKVDIPIDYYGSMGSFQTLYGCIAEWNSISAAETERFRQDCETYYKEKNQIESNTIYYDYGLQVSVVTCLKCTYQNLLEEEENVYYLFDSHELTSQINQEYGEGWFQRHDDMLKAELFLYSDIIEAGDVGRAFELIDEINGAGDLYKDLDDL